MGRPRKHHPKSPKPKPSGVVTVLSDLAPDGRTYIATVQLDGDTARTLNRDGGFAWASTVLDVAARAEHDALVLRQLHHAVGIPLHLAASCSGDLRADRPPVDDAATVPLRLEPGVNAKGEPFIGVHINGAQVGQWTCQDARDHAQGILEVLSAVDLDAAYFRYLIGTLDIDPAQARGIVGSLMDLRPGAAPDA